MNNYMNRKNRDAAYAAAGGSKAGLRKTSIRNQLIHPQYIVDYTKETGTVLTSSDCGFGNTIYKTHFPVLYSWRSMR